MKYAQRTSGLTKENLPLHYFKSDQGCWEWNRATFACGYGAKTIGGKVFYAHRLVFEIFKGLIPSGLVVMHSCDNRRCVNPSHLEAGTQRKNLSDARERGRLLNYTNQPKGSNCAGAKLTEEIVRAERNAWSDGRASIAEIARRNGVDKSTMRDAIHGNTWAHVI